MTNASVAAPPAEAATVKLTAAMLVRYMQPYRQSFAPEKPYLRVQSAAS